MRPGTIAVVLLLPALLLGCADEKARKDIADLRTELRERRFRPSDPKLEVSVLKSEVLPATGEYDDPKVRVTGVVRQDGDYSIQTYTVELVLHAKFADESVVTIRTEVPIKNKSGAFTADTTLYGVKTKPLAQRLKAIELADAGWWQPRDWNEFVTFHATAPESSSP